MNDASASGALDFEELDIVFVSHLSEDYTIIICRRPTADELEETQIISSLVENDCLVNRVIYKQSEEYKAGK